MVGVFGGVESVEDVVCVVLVIDALVDVVFSGVDVDFVVTDIDVVIGNGGVVFKRVITDCLMCFVLGNF